MADLPEFIDVNTLAMLLEVDTKWIQELANKGVMKKAKRGEYEFVASIKGYIAFLRERADGNNSAIVDHKVKLMRAKADMAEMEASERRGELIPAAQVQTAWETLVGHFRTKILAIPEKIAGRVLASTNVNQAREIIKRSINEALAELSSTDIEITNRGASDS